MNVFVWGYVHLCIVCEYVCMHVSMCVVYVFAWCICLCACSV